MECINMVFELFEVIFENQLSHKNFTLFIRMMDVDDRLQEILFNQLWNEVVNFVFFGFLENRSNLLILNKINREISILILDVDWNSIIQQQLDNFRILGQSCTMHRICVRVL